MKYKKSMFIVLLAIFLFSLTGVFASEMDTPVASDDTGQVALSVNDEGIDDNLQTGEENTKLAVDENDETLSSESDSEILTENKFTYSDLRDKIGSGGNINLTKGTYTYNDGDGDTIEITTSGVINGNGAVIDMAQSGHRAFEVTVTDVTIKNLTIKNANYDGNGGAIYFSSSGTVTNCNFVNNTAEYNGGAVYIWSNGNVTNCNFTNNKVTADYSYGGAILFAGKGNVTNCNFTNNSASGDGGAINMDSGTVENCNFTNNSASGDGGAIRMYLGTVSNCNFADNSANRGGAILSVQYLGVTADTCIFKTDSDTTFNTHNLPPTLNADNFTTFYGSGKKLTFDLRTNLTSIPVNNGNISISVYFKENNSWVRNYSCLSGEGWIPELPVGSYYAIFDTEYAEFQPINRTITITIPKTQYYINVTSLTTNNKTVNITAKSDIPKDLFWDGKLLFIVPNSDPINAIYAGNGTWWAVHTFADYTTYQVNATYEGLDNVTINNGTISISKTPTNITVENATVDLFIYDSVVTGARLTPADAGNLTFTSSNSSIAKVEKGNIIAVGEGTANITVSFAGSDDYAAAENKTITVNVVKYDSKVTISPINDTVYPNNVTIKYTVENKTNVTVIIDGVSSDKIIITNDTITVIGLDAGKYTITIINNESDLYYKSSDTKSFTVKLATSIAAADISTTYNINKDLVVTLKDSTGKALSGVKVTVDLNGAKTYTTDSNGQVKVPTKGLAPKTYTVKIAFNGNTNYDKSVKEVKVTVKKATPKIIAKKKTYKAKAKTKKFTITLKDNTGKAIKKAKVRLIVKKITNKKVNKKKTKSAKKKNIVKTNSKGKATFKIERFKKGKYLLVIKFAANKYYTALNKKVKITLR